MKFKMGEHQLYAEYVMDSGVSGLGVFYEAGTGKTQIALSRAYHLVERGDSSSVLVVCPASLVPNWHAAVDKMLMFEGYTEEGVAALKAALTVTSFQKTWRTSKRTVHRRDGSTYEVKRFELREEVDRQWDVVIVDEAHAIGDHRSKQTKACLALAERARWRYALTGTPVSGGGGGSDFSKLYGLVNFIRPDTWHTWREFCARAVTRFNKWYAPTEYNTEYCEKVLRDCAVQMRLRDCVSLPAETHEYMDCPLKEGRTYRDIGAGRTEAYGIDLKSAGAKYTKMLQICSGSLITDDGTDVLDTSKDDLLRDIANGTEEPMVVFCTFRASVQRCADILRRTGRTVTVYDSGSEPDAWREFQDGKTDAIVCQIQKGGVGLDLFRAHLTVYWEPCWSVLNLEQSAARTMRTGQTCPCRYIYFRTPGTVEARAWEAVRSGVDVNRDLFERWARDGVV